MAAVNTTPDVESVREVLHQAVSEARRRFDEDPECIAVRADARELGVKDHVVYAFKQRHNLPGDQRLSTGARDLLIQEMETASRAAKGEQIARGKALALIAERATPDAAEAIADAVPFSFDISRATGNAVWVSSSHLEAYLINRVEAITGKRYRTAGAALKRAATIAPSAVPAAKTLRGSGSDEDRDRLILFWGVVLRLDQLVGPPPADPVAFYGWCQLPAYQRHVSNPMEGLGDVMSGRMRSTDARVLLGLPVSGPLAPGAIRSAYRAEARRHHPDAGGDRRCFEQLSNARDRLLMTMG